MSRTLPKRATAAEARKFADYSKDQWKTFYSLTKLEANKIKHLTWHHVPANTRAEIRARVNNLLVIQGIPAADDSVFSWRMSNALRDTKHTLTNKAANRDATAARPLLQAKVAVNDACGEAGVSGGTDQSHASSQ
ncbi:hypothetical protein K458DRAFT_392674 [Lentithecium fluviatile CBS 122367]|uniref:Uncharacterized protein n=1 Tax=Lentithecium fluviatile CBS 122367 TaxID=1168545 RepID=A0A6G1IQV4_9PLEO|nr:hypothetical protein K458DRAFT_392674 [Lentithecium fluviatile CBS 122367]